MMEYILIAQHQVGCIALSFPLQHEKDAPTTGFGNVFEVMSKALDAKFGPLDKYLIPEKVLQRQPCRRPELPPTTPKSPAVEADCYAA